MPSCREIDPLVTPYVDGETTAAERAMVEAHLCGLPAVPAARGGRDGRAADPARTRVCRPARPSSCARAVARPRRRLDGLPAPYSTTSLSTLSFAAAVLMAGGVSVYGLTRSVAHGAGRAAHARSPEMLRRRIRPPLQWMRKRPKISSRATTDGACMCRWRLRSTGCSWWACVDAFAAKGRRVARDVSSRTASPSRSTCCRTCTRVGATAEVFGHDAVIWSDHDMTFVLLGEESPARHAAARRGPQLMTRHSDGSPS